MKKLHIIVVLLLSVLTVTLTTSAKNKDSEIVVEVSTTSYSSAHIFIEDDKGKKVFSQKGIKEKTTFTIPVDNGSYTVMVDYYSTKIMVDVDYSRALIQVSPSRESGSRPYRIDLIRKEAYGDPKEIAEKEAKKAKGKDSRIIVNVINDLSSGASSADYIDFTVSKVKNDGGFARVYESRRIRGKTTITVPVDNGTYTVKCTQTLSSTDIIVRLDSSSAVIELNPKGEGSFGRSFQATLISNERLVKSVPVKNMPAVVKAAFNKLDPVFQQNLKPNATIAVFLASADSLDNADDIYTQLQVNIMNTGRYDLVEKRRVDELLTEHDFQRAGLVSDDSLISFGKLLGADAVILSSVTGREKEKRLVLIAVDMANRATLAIAKEKL